MIAYSLSTDMRPAPGTWPTPEHYDRVIELVRSAEGLGYRTVWVSEQHGVDDGYLPAPITALSAIARQTRTIRLGTGIQLLTLAQPRRVAQEAGLLDQLSHGRLTLGFGAGHHPHEFRLYRRDLAQRARLMEEGVEFVRAALAGPEAPDGFPLNVPPVQRPLPVLLGGLARPAVDRAARLADGYYGFSFIDPDRELPVLWRELVEPAMRRHGRAAEGFRLPVSVFVWASHDWRREWRDHVGESFAYLQRRYAEWAGEPEDTLPGFVRDRPWDLAEVNRRMLVGPPEEISRRLAVIRAEYPFDELIVWPAPPGVPFDLAEKLLHTVATEVMPAVS